MKREKHTKERDLNLVTEYYLKGCSSRLIAFKIMEAVGKDEKGVQYNISHVTVAADIKFLLKQWRDDRIHDITNQKLIELTKIDKLEQTYWEAWEKSVENHKKVISKNKGKTTSATPEFSEITNMEIREFGEPRYLQGIERCIDKRCKLLGLDAPVVMKNEDTSFLSFLMHTQ